MLTFSELGRYGRIGNQMFQISGTIGIALKMEYEFGFPYWRNYDHRDRFVNDEDIDIQSWFKKPLPKINEGSYMAYNIKWGYHDVSPPDNSDLKGHMQSELYFMHCQGVVREYFEFKKQGKKLPGTVAVHFRGKDYGDDYHPRCSKDYYNEAMKRFKGKKVFIFTDDPDSVEINGEMVRGNHSMEDLRLMTLCENHIIANSSFSWWAAWLACSDHVVAPAKWFGPKARLITKDIYPKQWDVI